MHRKKLWALANKRRYAIIQTLLRGEKDVSSLLAKHKGTQPGMSQALHILLKAGLVNFRKAGRNRVYFVVKPAELVTALNALEDL